MTHAATPATGLHAHASDDKSENALAAKIILTVVVLLAAWGVSVFKWGVPGLYLPALAAVPLIYALLITVAKG